jgi:hypothetical protein
MRDISDACTRIAQQILRVPVSETRALLASSMLRLAIVALLMITGCKTVRPYDRENLARPVMTMDPEPGPFALQQHVLSTREGSVGGFGGGGGGCGCN